MATISVSELHSLLDQDAVLTLIDVRTPQEFEEGHVPGARNIPLDELDAAQRVRSGELPADQPIYILCRSGKRATAAQEIFQKAGYHHVHVVEGGTLAWSAEDFSLQIFHRKNHE